jgi:hypothetical protein
MSTATAAAARGRVRVETGLKRVRAYLGGEVVADTTRPLLVWGKCRTTRPTNRQARATL